MNNDNLRAFLRNVIFLVFAKLEFFVFFLVKRCKYRLPTAVFKSDFKLINTNNYKLLFLTIFLFTYHIAISQDCSSCNAALVKDRLTSSTNVFIDIAYLENISQTDYEQLKTDASAGFSLPLPIGGDLIDILKGSTNYDDFKQKLSVYKQSLQSSYKYTLNIDVTTVTTNPIAYKYWSECMQSCNSKTGVIYWIQEDNAGYIAVSLKYLPPPGAVKHKSYQLKVITEDSLYTIRGTLLPNGSHTEVCKRKFKNSHSNTIIAINANGYSGTLKSDYILNNNNQVGNISISYNVTNIKSVSGPSKMSDNRDGQRNPSAFNISNMTIPCPTNSSIRLPFPISCDHQWMGTYVELHLPADNGYSFLGTPTVANLECLNGACDWNRSNISNGECGDHRKTFIIAVDNPAYKIVYVNVGSGSTTYRLTMLESQTVSQTQTLPFLNTPENTTIFTLSKQNLNNLQITIAFLNNTLPVTINFEQLKTMAQLADNGNSYLVTFSGTNKQNLTQLVMHKL